MKLKKLFLVFTIFMIVIFPFSFSNRVEAEELPIDIEDLSNEDLLDMYDQITEEYTNEEIADMILENKEEIIEQGISEDVVDAGAEFIRNTDQQEIRNIIKNDINIDDIKQKLNQGYTTTQALESTLSDTSTYDKIKIVVKVLLANSIVKTVLWIILILFVYCTITRWIIYKKAGKHGFAAIIPFYRQVTMYKICGLSPFLMLLWLIPVIGWIILFVIAIAKRILLSEAFGRGTLFGIGLLLFAPIFQSVLAFNRNIEYEGEE